MLPENILQSDVLDIVFENRNKQYGAYALRKDYNKRLQFSVAGTLLFALVLSAFMMLKSKYHNAAGGFIIPDGATLINVSITPHEPEPPKNQPPKEKIAQANFSTPIVTNDNNVTSTITPVDSLGGRIIGNSDTPGILSSDEPAQPPAITDGDGHGTQETEAPITTPVWAAEQMPEFPGGINAYLKFMQKNLRQPDDINEGEKISVQALFVVNADGSISNATIITSGREDLDKEVLRVISRMPLWKPGIQNGQPVLVYFKMPVTFVAAEQ